MLPIFVKASAGKTKLERVYCFFSCIYTMPYRIINRMKVTALIPDQLVRQIKHYSQAKNLTGGLLVALEEWVALKKISELNELIEQEPLKFKYSAAEIRKMNRRRS